MTPEFSRLYRLDELGSGTRTVTIEADASERAALAARFALIGIDRLDATVALVRDGDTVIATGTLAAQVTQACVASGEPVPAPVSDAFALRFVPEGVASAAEDVELGEADLDELTYTGGSVDVGEATAQTLALALDPFPRAPGAEERLRAAGVVGEEDTGPFAALKALRDTL